VEKRWPYLRWLRDLHLDSRAYGARSFSILLLCSSDAKHVTVDTKVLHGLLKRIAKRTGGMQIRHDARIRG
jgi:hypothetical protein